MSENCLDGCCLMSSTKWCDEGSDGWSDKGTPTFVHSNSKFRVFTTEAFRSEKSTETSEDSIEVSGEINETFESVSTHPKFRF
jgi:hypothetical protein